MTDTKATTMKLHQELSWIRRLISSNIDAKIRNTCLISLLGFGGFLLSVAFHVYLATTWSGILGPRVLLSTVSRGTYLDEPPSPDIVKKGILQPILQLSADIWFALSIPAAADATLVVFNGNRSLIHQFHYCVSMKMLCLATIISTGAYIILGNSEKTEGTYHPVLVIILGGALYIICVFIMDMFHTLVPSRSVSSGHGSLKGFLATLGCFDVSWIRAGLYTKIVGGFGVALLLLLPPKLGVFIPPMHFVFEMVLLTAMGTRLTPRYNTLYTPIGNGHAAVHWGISQLISTPRLTLQPWAFLVLMVISRILLDLHLHTILRHRKDFQWARRNVLFPTRTLITAALGLLLLERIGIQLVTYAKIVAVVFFYSAAFVVTTVPAAYIIASGKLRQIRD